MHRSSLNRYADWGGNDAEMKRDLQDLKTHYDWCKRNLSRLIETKARGFDNFKLDKLSNCSDVMNYYDELKNIRMFRQRNPIYTHYNRWNTVMRLPGSGTNAMRHLFIGPIQNDNWGAYY